MVKAKNISYSSYMECIDRISTLDASGLIAQHKDLIGKVCVDGNNNEIDCGIGFVQEIFNRSSRMSFREFIYSKYLSDYFKNGIKKLILQEKPGYIVANAHRINENDNIINGLDSAELYDIFSLIREYFINESLNRRRMMDIYVKKNYNVEHLGSIESAYLGRISTIFSYIFIDVLKLCREKPDFLEKLMKKYESTDEIIRVASDDELKEILSFLQVSYQKMISQYESVNSIINSIRNVMLASAPNGEDIGEGLDNYTFIWQDFDTIKGYFLILKSIYHSNSAQRKNIDDIVKSIISLFLENKDSRNVRDMLNILAKENGIENLTDGELNSITHELATILYHGIKAKSGVDSATRIIKEVLPVELVCSDNTNILSILNSDKSINSMSEEEIKTIYTMVAEIIINAKKDNRSINSIASNIMDFLFRLDGTGVASFIMTNTDRQFLANYILSISGTSIDVNSYMLGYGVDLKKLNQNNLLAIFNKLLNLNKDYAIEFANMVMNIDILDVTAFINRFNVFICNEFRDAGLMITNSDAYEDVFSRNKNGVPVLLSEMFNFPTKQDSLDVTKKIKEGFLLAIRPIMEYYDPDFIRKYYESEGDRK